MLWPATQDHEVHLDISAKFNSFREFAPHTPLNGGGPRADPPWLGCFLRPGFRLASSGAPEEGRCSRGSSLVVLLPP